MIGWTGMAAARCSDCGINWPADLSQYRTCKVCGEPTDWMITSDPITVSEANHLAFDAFYAKREMEKHTAELASLPEAVTPPPAPPAQGWQFKRPRA